MFFNWIRQAAKNAVLGGVADALDELDPADAVAKPANLERLRGLAATEAKQLAAAKTEDEEPEPARGRGKGK